MATFSFKRFLRGRLSKCTCRSLVHLSGQCPIDFYRTAFILCLTALRPRPSVRPARRSMFVTPSSQDFMIEYLSQGRARPELLNTSSGPLLTPCDHHHLLRKARSLLERAKQRTFPSPVYWLLSWSEPQEPYKFHIIGTGGSWERHSGKVGLLELAYILLQPRQPSTACVPGCLWVWNTQVCFDQSASLFSSF